MEATKGPFGMPFAVDSSDIAAKGESVGLRDTVLKIIIDRASEIFQKDRSELTDGTLFVEDMHIKSVNYVQFVAALEDELDVEINFVAFRKRKTFGEAADLVVELCEEWLEVEK